MKQYVFYDKALCNEFIARLNLRHYSVLNNYQTNIQNKLVRTTLLQVHDNHDLQDFISNDYVCNRDPNTLIINTLSNFTLIYVTV